MEVDTYANILRVSDGEVTPWLIEKPNKDQFFWKRTEQIEDKVAYVTGSRFSVFKSNGEVLRWERVGPPN